MLSDANYQNSDLQKTLNTLKLQNASLLQAQLQNKIKSSSEHPLLLQQPSLESISESPTGYSSTDKSATE